MKPLVFVLVCAALMFACRNPSASDEGARPAAGPASALGPGPLVTGTVLDARTGQPIPGARVRGPGGAEARSDAHGRFVLRGLGPGTAGDLVGTTESGLRGKNVLRPLEGCPLEVVLHLRSPAPASVAGRPPR